jgi:HNH endonuclease
MPYRDPEKARDAGKQSHQRRYAANFPESQALRTANRIERAASRQKRLARNQQIPEMFPVTCCHDCGVLASQTSLYARVTSQTWAKYVKRFWAYVAIGNADTCWLWQGDTILHINNKAAYGRLNIAGKLLLAHRLSWEFIYGEIPSGLLVLHTCDNGMCVNPHHLFLGTHLDNSNDKMQKGRQAIVRGMKNPKAKLTDDDVRYIREHRSHMKLKELAEMFNVTDVMISYICLRKSWAHIP